MYLKLLVDTSGRIERWLRLCAEGSMADFIFHRYRGVADFRRMMSVPSAGSSKVQAPDD